VNGGTGARISGSVIERRLDARDRRPRSFVRGRRPQAQNLLGKWAMMPLLSMSAICRISTCTLS
jgi:hypothetical protein